MNKPIETIARVATLLVLPLPLAVCADQPATITVDAVHQRLESGGATPLIVDVREPNEYEAGHIDGARLAPLGRVASELESVAKDREIVLVCRSGNRSGKAQKILAGRGYTKLRNMQGGMLAWEKQGYPITK